MIILIVFVCILLLWAFFKFVKIPKFGNMVLITGGVKTGKSTMSVYFVVRQYWKQKIKYYFYNYFLRPVLSVLPFKRFKILKKREYPLLYSNIPLAVKGYTPLTLDLIERKTRFRYGSVIYVCESSLVADSQSIKNPLLNEEMLLFNKLIAHETKGGYIFYDTQSISDNHYAVKRCLSNYFYIHHTIKIPFLCFCYVRELKYSDDVSSVNAWNEDVEESLKLVIVPKFVWKLFDCYCYSSLTDDLKVEDRSVNVFRSDSKKANKIVTFKNFKSIDERFLSKNEKED